MQGSRATAQSRGQETCVLRLKILSLHLPLPFSSIFLVPSFLLTPAHLASPLLHPFVPLVEKLLEGQAAIPEKVP